MVNVIDPWAHGWWDFGVGILGVRPGSYIVV
jgi:hypothetical protein